MWRRCILLTLALALGVLSVLLVPHGPRARLHAAVQRNVEVPKTDAEVSSEARGRLREVNLEDVPKTLPHITLIQPLYNRYTGGIYVGIHLGYSLKVPPSFSGKSEKHLSTQTPSNLWGSGCNCYFCVGAMESLMTIEP